MKYLIAGRSGTGKTELAKRLEAKGLSVLKTYTTRPCRGGDDAERYHFVKPEDVDGIPGKILRTDFVGGTYFATKDDVTAADVLVLDPAGVREVLDLFPDTMFDLVYLTADRTTADEMAVARAEDRDAERKVINERRLKEDAIFGPLEKLLDGESAGHSNLGTLVEENDFEPETLDGLAAQLVAKYRMNRNFVKILEMMDALGAVKTDPDGKIPVEYPDGKRPVSLDLFAEAFIGRDDVVADIVRSWMTHEIDFRIPGELAPEPVFRAEVPAG